jgi:hypothetical protein
MFLPRFPGILLLMAVTSAACAPTDPGNHQNTDGGTLPTVTVEQCDGIELIHIPVTTWGHTDTCEDSGCGNGVNPPTGGPHCPFLLKCDTFTNSPNRCQWIHNLEHGHAVLAYNCPLGCPQLVTTLEGFAQSAKKDNSGNARALVVSDPAIPKKVAAMVAGWSYSSETADDVAIACLLKKQDLEAPESGYPCSQ